MYVKRRVLAVLQISAMSTSYLHRPGAWRLIYASWLRKEVVECESAWNCPCGWTR